jgi:hypothetical protein
MLASRWLEHRWIVTYTSNAAVTVIKSSVSLPMGIELAWQYKVVQGSPNFIGAHRHHEAWAATAI